MHSQQIQICCKCKAERMNFNLVHEYLQSSRQELSNYNVKRGQMCLSSTLMLRRVGSCRYLIYVSVQASMHYRVLGKSVWRWGRERGGRIVPTVMDIFLIVRLTQFHSCVLSEVEMGGIKTLRHRKIDLHCTTQYAA